MSGERFDDSTGSYFKRDITQNIKITFQFYEILLRTGRFKSRTTKIPVTTTRPTKLRSCFAVDNWLLKRHTPNNTLRVVTVVIQRCDLLSLAEETVNRTYTKSQTLHFLQFTFFRNPTPNTERRWTQWKRSSY